MLFTSRVSSSFVVLVSAAVRFSHLQLVVVERLEQVEIEPLMQHGSGVVTEIERPQEHCQLVHMILIRLLLAHVVGSVVARRAVMQAQLLAPLTPSPRPATVPPPGKQREYTAGALAQSRGGLEGSRGDISVKPRRKLASEPD
eukprot:3297420-Pyramimonas_sp.AAC.1